MIIEAKYLRAKMIEELYIGMLFLGIILSLLILKDTPVNLFHMTIFFVIFSIYLLYYFISFIKKAYLNDNL